MERLTGTVEVLADLFLPTVQDYYLTGPGSQYYLGPRPGPPDIDTGYILLIQRHSEEPSKDVTLISTQDKSGISEDLSHFIDQWVTVEGEYKIIENQTFFDVYRVTAYQVSPEIAPGGFPREPTGEITTGETITTAKTAGFSTWGIFLLLGAALFMFSEKKKK